MLTNMIGKLTLLCLLSVALAIEKDGDVLVLTDGNFKDAVAGEDIMLVEFYAPWCGHCKRLAPEYAQAATSLKTNDPPIPLAKVDCTEAGKDSCGKYGVSGYPTLKIFRGGELSEDYNGPREKDGIVKYMKGKAGPSSKELTDVAMAEKFLAKNEYVVIAFINENDDMKSTFMKVADQLRESMSFGHTTNKEVIDKFGAADEIHMFQPKILHSKFEEKDLKYEGDMKSTNKLKDWVKESKVGLCPHRTGENAEDIKKPFVAVYYDVDYTKNVKGTNYWRNRVMKVSQKLKDAGKTVQFAISSVSEFTHELNELGVSSPDGSKPTVAGRNAKDQKFVMSEEFSMDNLEKFANDMLDNKLEPYLKSEPVPEQTEAVKVAVAKNFDEIVPEDKDVLIEFYAPWCGHCKSLEPKYKELAEKLLLVMMKLLENNVDPDQTVRMHRLIWIYVGLKSLKLQDEPNLVIAKMDATANDVPSAYQVQGFPTIYFKPKGESPKQYQGGREVSDFISYLQKEATTPLNYSGEGKKKKKSKKTEL